MKKLISIILAITIFSFVVSAEGSSVVIDSTFDSSESRSCFSRDRQIGDVNADGEINASDLLLLRKRLLGIKVDGTYYFDVNVDNKVNILDFVSLSKLIASYVKLFSYDTDAKSYVMVLNGAVSYTEDFVSKLEKNTYYQISYRYKTESSNPLVLTLNGLSDNTITFTSSVSSGWVEEYFVFKTGANLTSYLGNELKIEGYGRIDDFKISEVTDYWYDRNLSAQGGLDKFKNGNY